MLLGVDALGFVLLGFVLLGFVLLGFVLLGFVVLEVDELLVGFVELEVLVVELVLVEDSTVLLSEGVDSEVVGVSEDVVDSAIFDDSVTGTSGSTTGTSSTISGSSTGISLLSGIETTLSIVPVSTIKEDSSGSSPAFNTPLRILISPPMKTRTPQTPIIIFFMNWFLSKSN